MVALDVKRAHIVEGAAATVRVSLQRNGFSDAVAVTVAGLPAGVTADPLTITADIGTLTLHAAADAPQGDAALTVTAVAGAHSHDVALSLLAMGPSGTPDKTFAAGGMLSTPPAGQAASMVLQPDGKIVIGGVLALGVNQFNGVEVARFLPTGALDSSFSGGIVKIAAAQNTGAVALQPDGKIVVVGTTNGQAQGVVVRLNADGSLDNAFGTGGKQLVNLNDPSATAGTGLNAVVVQPDGGIVVAGFTNVAVGGQDAVNAVIARLAPTGMLDNSFGTTGRTASALGLGRSAFESLVLQADGKIVAVGVAGATSTSNNIAAFARFGHDGKLDSSFNQTGFRTIDLGSPATVGGDFTSGVSVALQPDGKIVAAGSASASTVGTDSAVVRLNGTDGSPDTTFGTNGVKIVSLGDARSNADVGLALQPDGKVVIGGGGFVAGAANQFVARLGTDALLDLGFAGGLVAVPVPPDGNGDESGSYNAIALDTDGRIITAGSTSFGSGAGSISLARFWP